ncbi:MAG: hypothetical protein QM691_14380 [Opitutaceae bacterium]
MRIWPLLILLLACRAGALEPQVRLILPAKITGDLSRTTIIRPEVELTNGGEKPLPYRVYGPEDHPIWAGTISFELRYGTGTKVSPLWESMADHFGSRSLVLAPGASVTLRYRRPISGQLWLAGNYQLQGSTRLVDETGKDQEVLVTPATFILEDKPRETAAPASASSNPSGD